MLKAEINHYGDTLAKAVMADLERKLLAGVDLSQEDRAGLALLRLMYPKPGQRTYPTKGI